jgi:DNA (cytosine-5)-methyltransferase 1
MNELHLFAGAGGGILAGQLLGHRCVCAVEWEPYAQAVLVARQNDGTFPPFPIWDDVQTFDGRKYRGIVDVVCGGFPCQDISAQGGGDGLDGERSGMWREMARIICEVQPNGVLVENSPMLTSRGLGTVLGDLAAMGFDAQWGVLGASDFSGPHKRERIWIVAHTDGDRLEGRHNSNWQGHRKAAPRPIQTLDQMLAWPDVSNPRAFGSCDGLAYRNDRLKAIGNGQVPRVAAAAFTIFSSRISTSL